MAGSLMAATLAALTSSLSIEGSSVFLNLPKCQCDKPPAPSPDPSRTRRVHGRPRTSWGRAAGGGTGTAWNMCTKEEEHWHFATTRFGALMGPSGRGFWRQTEGHMPHHRSLMTYRRFLDLEFKMTTKNANVSDNHGFHIEAREKCISNVHCTLGPILLGILH